jgi:S1-C subfamily serine protease
MFTLLAALAIAAPTPSTPPQSMSAVSVMRHDGTGSGTVIARHGKQALILTNRHVCPDDSKVWVLAIDGTTGRKKRYPAHLYAVNPGNDKDGSADVALVVAEIDNPAMKMATASPKVGDRVHHFGHATGPQDGVVSEIAEYAYPGRPRHNISAMLAVPCDSGAAVVNEKNELCGVHHSSRVRSDDAEYSVSCRLEQIRPFLKTYAAGWGDW